MDYLESVSQIVEPVLDIADGYTDAQQGIDRATTKALKESVKGAVTVGGAVASASVAGAGSLAGYAGMASAVSTMGLGGVTTAVAGAMGSSATGAAATAVVTAALGGPACNGSNPRCWGWSNSLRLIKIRQMVIRRLK